MRPGHDRTVHYTTHYQRDVLAGLVESALSRLGVDAEGVALYLVVAALWGIIFYVAIQFALP